MFQATTFKGSATNHLDAGIVSDLSIYNIQPRCPPNSTFRFSIGQSPLNFTKGIKFKRVRSEHEMQFFTFINSMDKSYLITFPSCMHIPSLLSRISLASIYCPYSKLSSQELLLWWINSNLFFLSKPEMRCVQGLTLWRNSSKEVNHEIFKGYQKGNSDGMISEIAAGCSKSLSFIFNA